MISWVRAGYLMHPLPLVYSMLAIVITGYYAKPACYTNSVSKAGGHEALLIGNQ